MTRNIYQEVTDRIITELETGTRPWIKPWSADHAAVNITRPLRSTGEAYRGINTLLLWSAAANNGYQSPYWLTFNQAKKIGAHVQKGEKGTAIVYASTIEKTGENDQGENVTEKIPFMKGYTVFNAEQVADLPESWHPGVKQPEGGPERIGHAETFVNRTGATIHEGGAQAAYSATLDLVKMPPLAAFQNAETYYTTLLHELTHWTKHPSRLDRNLGRKKWGDEGYAREELVAELGSAFLACDLSLELEPREDHAAYIGSWLQLLRDDKRAIFEAAARAQSAADYLHQLQGAESAAA